MARPRPGPTAQRVLDEWCERVGHSAQLRRVAPLELVKQVVNFVIQPLVDRRRPAALNHLQQLFQTGVIAGHLIQHEGVSRIAEGILGDLDEAAQPTAEQLAGEFVFVRATRLPWQQRIQDGLDCAPTLQSPAVIDLHLVHEVPVD